MIKTVQNLILSLSAFIVSVFFLVQPVYAVITPAAPGAITPIAPTFIGPTPAVSPPVSSFQDLQIVLGNIIQAAQIIFWILAVAIGLLSAYTFLTAAGDPERLKKARNYLIYAAVAVIVAIVSYGIPTIVKTALIGF